MKRITFTLAGVLITLAMIGVVAAAITMPIIFENYRLKQLGTGLKKSYSVIAQALDMYFAENGERITSDVGRHELKSKLMQYMNNIQDCGYGTSDVETACVTITKNWNYMNFTGKKLSVGYFDDGLLILSDGTNIFIENTSNSSLVFISIDVNGFYKNPNRLGHDFFMFQIDEDGSLLPMGKEGTNYYSETDEYCSETSTDSMNGAGCTYKALTDKDYFKNLPK